ncbi:unnamed protein product [Parnassius mnemosyne]|uniref:ABC transporter domain-containing protein n=1 Tax=Parnassius mnemosyne TaxID=213953 RepID=A0AAV1KQ43_9NEOP
MCSDVETKTFSDREEHLTNPDKLNYTKGRKLILIQMKELFKRQFDYTVSKLVAFIFIQFLVPFVMCILLTQLFTNANEKEFFVMDLYVYSEVDAPVATYNYRSNSPDIVKTIDTIRNLYPNLILQETNRNHNKRCTCKKCKEQSKALLTRSIIDVYVDEQGASLRYDPTVKHSAAVGLNLLSNIIASQRLQRDGKTINMQLVFGHWPSMKPKDEINCILFVIFNIFIIMATAINDVALPCRERITNSRYLHIMAGCPPVLYWIVTLVYHMTSYMLLYCSGTMVAAAFFDTDHTLNNSATLKAYFLGLFLCGISFYVFAYFLSYFFNEKTTGVILLTLVIIFGLFTPLVMFGFEALGVPLKTGIFFNFLNNIGVLIPPHMFTQTIKKMTDVSRFNAYCSHYYQFCPARTVLPNNFDTSICCDRSLEYGAWFNHYTMSEYGMGKSLVVVIAQIVVFTSLVLLLEYRLISRLWSEVEKRRTLVLPTRKYDSSDVAEEKQYVSNTIIRSKGTIKEVMLVSRTWKAYFKLFEKPTFALKDLNYSVKEGECFGIIGLNGAGKTTNFKVITRQEYPTRGTIYANGYFADAHPAEYLRGLGYSPQSFGFDNFRTGEDNLRILMALRGLSKEDIKNETRAWLSIIGLHEYGGRRTVDYSGGMTRRLAVGAALCGGAHAALLDEPTAGVDTAAKRQVWLAVKRALTHGRCVVLSSHNMDEVERLCNRVTILDSGEMGALGSPNRYKESYAPGHTAVFKLRVNSVLSSVGAIRVQSLKDFMDHEFDCFLKDEHLTTLRFTIMENLAYNVIFIKLGFLAAEFDDIVEDYSAYDANMEDAFMHFVKESRYSIRPIETW